MNYTLKNKRALVTGGSRGIGAGIVKRLASEGVDVAFTYNKSSVKANEIMQAAQTLGIQALAIQADSAEASAVVAAVEQTVEKLGGIDILVNNAGVLAVGLIDNFTLADFDQILAVNVRAVFVATQAAVKYMKEGGRIINISSTHAERMPFAGGSVYAMSKSALCGLVKGLARDLGLRGITINNIQPGPIDTDMNSSEGELSQMFKQQMAVSNYGTVEEVAGMVAYLAGAETGYITGASLTIDGGFSA